MQKKQALFFFVCEPAVHSDLMCVCLAGKASKGSDLSAAFIQVVHLGGITNLFDKPMWITPADEGFFRPIEISAMLSCSLFKTDAAQKKWFSGFSTARKWPFSDRIQLQS